MNLSSNRIQQNPTRNNRPVPNRPATQRPSVAQANALSNYGTTTRVRSLYVGQILKGEVSDLRNREIVLTLENNTTVSAHLEEGSWLAIGEISAFKVLSANQDQITLEALPRSDMALANSTVQKALEEAGLPNTEKNQQIVLELMKNQLPIHKQSILQMLQTSFQNQEISIPTLVLMTKHQIPITTQNAEQFEHYQNNTHFLSTGLENLAKDLSSMVHDLATNLSENSEYVEISKTVDTPVDSLLQQSFPNSPQNQVLQQLFQHTNMTAPVISNNTMQTTVARILSTFLNEESFTVDTSYNNFNIDNNSQSVSPDTLLPNINMDTEKSVTPDATIFDKAVSDTPLSDTTTAQNSLGSEEPTLPDQTIDFLKETERTELISILENFDLPDDLRNDIQDGTASLRQVVQQLEKDYEVALTLDRETLSQELPENEIPEEITAGANLSKEEGIMLRTSLFDSPVVKDLETKLQSIQTQTRELGSRLSLEERITLKEYVKDFPMDDSVKEQISNGTLKTEDFLRIIKNVLPFTETETAAPLLSSRIFSSMMEDTILDRLFLTPREIFSQGGVNTYYQKLSRQLEELDSLFEKNMHSRQSNIQQMINTLSTQPKDQITQLKDNLDFMKLLNHFFSYIQLPTKLQEKFTRADLYVYTRKKNLKQQQNPIRVLLHLDMDNLGALDVQVSLKNRDVTSIFHTGNDKVGKLISTNFSLLEEALGSLGYTSTNQIAKLEKKVDIVNDFIAPESARHAISRYSFDLRA